MGINECNLLRKLCPGIVLHDDIKEIKNGPFKKFRVARNRIVAVKTNFLKSDAAILIKILPYRKLQIRCRQKWIYLNIVTNFNTKWNLPKEVE